MPALGFALAVRRFCWPIQWRFIGRRRRVLAHKPGMCIGVRLSCRLPDDGGGLVEAHRPAHPDLAVMVQVVARILADSREEQPTVRRSESAGIGREHVYQSGADGGTAP